MLDDFENGKILEIHLAENDKLHEAIVAKCRELGIFGATVFRGLEGYGLDATIHRQRLMGRDQPIVVKIVDRAEVIEKAIPALSAILGKGLMVLSDVRLKRIRNQVP